MDQNPLPGSSELSALSIPREVRPRRRRRRILPWVLLAVLSVAAGAGVAFRDQLFGPSLTVETAAVERTGGVGDEAILTANGYVTARRQAGVTAKVSGRIRKLYKDLGDRVTKDETLAELEDEDVLALLEEAKAGLWVNELLAERTKRLAEVQVGAREDHEIALAKAKEAAARVRNLEEQVANTRVRAPFDGVIIVKNGEVGETVSLFGAQTSRKTGPIFVIADFNEFEVEADVNEANIGKVQIGQPASVAIDAVPERRYRGTLRQIVPTADRQKATVQVKVTILDPDQRVYPEMSAKVTFLKTDSKPEPLRILVPASAIVARGGRKVVFLVEDDRVAEVPVDLGVALGTSVVIASGLSGGESVVLRPSPELAAGAKVRVRRSP